MTVYGICKNKTKKKIYTQAEVDALLEELLSKKSNTGHDHDSRYYTESEIDTKLKDKAAANHSHNDTYYTESEVNDILKSYSKTNHSHSKSDIGLGNVPNVATNDQTPTYSAASTLATLSSGEKLSTSMGKIMKAISDFISHKNSTSNPHGVTKAQIGLGNVNNIKITSGTANPSGGSDGDIYLKY